MIKIILSRHHTVGSLILRGFLWSRWSHVGIIDGDEVIEAIAWKGVVCRSLKEMIEESSNYEIREFNGDEKVIQAARTQLGKKYDWAGVFGIAGRRKWQNAEAWFCSELAAWAFTASGFPLFRRDAFRITPRDIDIRIDD